MKLIHFQIILLFFCASCTEVTKLKIETNKRHQVGQTSNITVIQEKKGFITNNVSGETFGDFDIKCIDNSQVKVDIIKKENNDDCSSINDINSSNNNTTTNISERPISFQRKDSTTIKISIACYEYDFVVSNFQQNARFQLTIVSANNSTIKDSVQFQLDK